MSTPQDDIDTYPMPRHGWTCFHCGETFRTEFKARAHFGSTPEKITKCLRQRIAAKDRVSEELANWHRHKDELIAVLIAFTHANPKWQFLGAEQDPCGAHALLEWIQNETWLGFHYPNSTAEALAVDSTTKPLFLRRQAD